MLPWQHTGIHYLKGYRPSRFPIAHYRKSHFLEDDGGRIQHLYIPSFDPCSHVKSDAKQQQAAWPAILLMIYSLSSDGSWRSLWKARRGESSLRAAARPGIRTSVRKLRHWVAAAGRGAAGASSTSWLLQGALAGRARREKTKSRVDRSSTRVLAFSWRRGCAESNQGLKPAQPEQLSRIPATTWPSAAKSRVERQIARRSLSYARFGALLALQPCGKQPKPETSVARTAFADFGSNRAQGRCQLGRTRNLAWIVLASVFPSFWHKDGWKESKAWNQCSWISI